MPVRTQRRPWPVRRCWQLGGRNLAGPPSRLLPTPLWKSVVFKCCGVLLTRAFGPAPPIPSCKGPLRVQLHQDNAWALFGWWLGGAGGQAGQVGAGRQVGQASRASSTTHPYILCRWCGSGYRRTGPDSYVIHVCPSVRLSDRTGPDPVILYMCVILCVCVRPPIWAGPDWINLFLNHSRNHVFVKLDQAVCLCVRPSGLDRARPNFSSQDVCILMFIAILQTSQYSTGNGTKLLPICWQQRRALLRFGSKP